MEIARRLEADTFMEYMRKFGFDKKTGIDLPGEAVGIMHKEENVGPVELATMSFGQSFQITPIQLISSASSVINGGYKITPHFGIQLIDTDGVVTNINDEKGERIVSEQSSSIMRSTLEQVVASGTGNKTYLPGYRVGGKTATSEKLPRGNGKYIASFLAFAPADNPQVIALVIIDEPVGAYYGGQIAGPIMQDLLSNVLPYMNIEKVYTEEEMEMDETKQVTIPDLIGLTEKEAKGIIKDLGLELYIENENNNENGDKTSVIVEQFPMKDEIVNINTKIIVKIN